MGSLYVVATPIGNLEDITVRAIKILLSVPVIACEDTRHTGQLIKILEERYSQFVIPLVKRKLEEVEEVEGKDKMTDGVSLRDPSMRADALSRDDNSENRRNDNMGRRYVSVRDWNEAEVIGPVLKELEINDVALVSDAGTPLLSDPGFKLVRAASNAGFVVVPIPGAFAGAAALSAAGLPTNKFLFWGFLPKKWQFDSAITHVIYEAPTRVVKTVSQIRERYPEAKIVIANELTKVHERIEELEKWNDLEKIKGEVTIIVYIPERS